MKPATKSYLVLSLIILAAVSCGPVTPVTTPVSRSIQASQTPKSVLPAATRTITPPAASTRTSQPRMEHYELQVWSAKDDYYMDLAEKFSQEFYVEFNADRHTYELVFQAEKILRDPSSDWQAFAWDIVTRNPKGIPLPGMRSGQDLLAFLMENLLNNDNVKPEELPIIVKGKIRTTWECYRAAIVETQSKRGSYLVVENLFGNQKDGWIFYTGNCEGTAVYALRNIGDQYRVEKLRDWQALEITFAGYGLELGKAGDVNNNGIPEVFINVSYGASGTPPFSGQYLEFYEWDPSQEIFLSGRTEMFEDVCDSYETCDDGWRIEKVATQGVYPVIVKELHETMYDDLEGTTFCDHLVLEHTYLWRDGNFIEQKQTLLPPRDERSECRLSWALQVLNRNSDQAVIATQMISEALSDWPESMNEMWGPASEDYFRLRLGLAYDLMGDEDAALTLLQNVAEHPANPEFDFMPQMALIYLNVRSEQGKVRACQEINLLQAESEYGTGEHIIYNSVKSFREVWGVGAPIWVYSVNAFCDDSDMLEFSLHQAQNSQYETIDEWLREIGLEPARVQLVYESASLTTWLVSWPVQSLRLADDNSGMLERIEGQQIWLFTGTSRGFDGIYVDDTTGNTSLSVDYVDLEKSGLLVAVQPQDVYTKRLFVFHIDFRGTVQSQLWDVYVNGFVDHQTKEIVTISEAEQPEIAIYHWNDEGDSLNKRIINFDFSKAQEEAEKLLFQERNFRQTILYINMFLVQAPAESKEMSYCQLSDCRYSMDWYRPYMRYLLALAYELSGQTDEARDTYFGLSQDYPDNILGVSAAHRLIPVRR
jgi:hypothetical protein